MKKTVLLFGVLFGSLLAPLRGEPPSPPVYIRVDQVGYLSSERKTALALTNADLKGQSFRVIKDAAGGTAEKVVLTVPVGADRGTYGSFAHLYALSFDPVKESGKYHLQVGTAASPSFQVGGDAFAGVVPQTLKFFRVQRCGSTESLLHGVCHLKDGIAKGGPMDGKPVDAVGGWHDAGDYIKFMITVGATTNVMLAAYQRQPGAFVSPDSKEIPPVLSEARIGLDWMQKMWDPAHQVLYYQVGDGSDHNGWRLPEGDDAKRPVRFVYACEPGKGANVAGKAAAALALGSVLWSDRTKSYQDAALAARYLTSAKQIYAWGKQNPDAQPSMPEEFYGESSYKDDMALAAAELFRATADPAYLREARDWAKAAGSEGTLDWGTLNGLAHYEIARVDPTYLPIARQRLQADLTDMQASANRANNPFHVALDFFDWGSASVMQGAALEALWYEDLSGDITYHAMAQDQRDFILGANPWGVSWVEGCGTTWTHHAHHVVADRKKVDLPGFWNEGAMRAKSWKSKHIELSGEDIYAAFQSPEAIYHDDKEDYATNEPTVFANALGLSLMSWYSHP